jgi:hypothetical protein
LKKIVLKGLKIYKDGEYRFFDIIIIFYSNLVELLRSLQEKKIEMFRSIKSLDENFTAINSKRTFIINRMMKVIIINFFPLFLHYY